MPAEPLTTAIAGSIGVAIRLSEFVLSVGAAPEEIRIFARLIKRVQRDREEALRERLLTKETLMRLPEKLDYINGVLADTDHALHVIGKIIEDGRIDGEKGRHVSLVHRFEWVMARREEFIIKQTLLSTCHSSLVVVLAYLQGLPHDMPSPAVGLATLSAPEQQCDAGSDAMLRSPSSRRPKPRSRACVLPDTSSLRAAPVVRDLWEKYEPKTGSHDTSSASDQKWMEKDRDEILRAATMAIVSLGGSNGVTRSIIASVQHAPDDVPSHDGTQVCPSQVLDKIDDTHQASKSSDERPPSVSRNSAMRRRRNIEAHFQG